MFNWSLYDKELVYTVHKFIPEIDLYSEEEILDIIDDIISANKKYLVTYNEYFLYNFYGASDSIRRTFIPKCQFKKTISNSLDRKFVYIYNSKYDCYKTFNKYFKRDAIKVENFDDYNEFKKFVSKHKKYIIKENDGSLGSNISVVNVKENDNIKDLFFYALQYGGCIIEEYLTQDPVFAAFNESSLNTIRLTTVYDNGKVDYLFSLAIFGKKNSIVNNGGQGGIISMVNPMTGEVISDGYTEDLERYIEHPDSHLAIKGFCVPKWGELLKIAEELAIKAKGVTVLGWDFALTDRGWAVIEANTQPSGFPIQMLMAQTFGRGIREEYEAMIGKYKDTKKIFEYEE